MVGASDDERSVLEIIVGRSEEYGPGRSVGAKVSTRVQAEETITLSMMIDTAVGFWRSEGLEQ
jgi:hypothetical protein